MTREEAIQIVKTTKDWGELRLALQELVPELRESEDEIHRKWILEYLYDGLRKADEQFKEHFKSAIDWFEKQKEQKPDIELIQRTWYMEGYQDRKYNREPKWIVKTGEGGPRYELNLKFGQPLAEKQKLTEIDEIIRKARSEGRQEVIDNPEYYQLQKPEEWQKPAEKQDYSGLNDCERAIHRGFLVAGVENVPVGIIKETAKDCIAHFPWPTGQSKENDEKAKKWLIEYLTRLLNSVEKTSPFGIEVSNAISFVKSTHSQSKQEWSKEDEKILHAIELHVGQLDSGETINGFSSSDMLRVLKSLRPSWKPSELEKGALRTAIHILTEERNFPKAASQLQNILDAFEGKVSRKDWKPSEEQLKALKSCFYESGECCPDEDGLRSLYEDIKKL